MAKAIILEVLKDADCKVFLFGSRAAKEHHRFSDMDIGVVPGENFEETSLHKLREKLQDSIIPFKVDVVNFSNVSAKFKDEALKEVIEWK